MQGNVFPSWFPAPISMLNGVGLHGNGPLMRSSDGLVLVVASSPAVSPLGVRYDHYELAAPPHTPLPVVVAHRSALPSIVSTKISVLALGTFFPSHRLDCWFTPTTQALNHSP